MYAPYRQVLMEEVLQTCKEGRPFFLVGVIEGLLLFAVIFPYPPTSSFSTFDPKNRQKKMSKKIFDFTKRNLSGSAEFVRKEFSEIESAYREAVGALLSSSSSSATPSFDSTFGALAGADGEAAFRSISCVIPSLISPCKEARTASAEAKKRLAAMWAETYSSVELYNLLRASQEVHGGDAQKQRLIASTLQKFEFSGAALSGAARDEFLTHFPNISKKASEFEQNINEDVTTVALDEAELEGCTDSFIASLPKDDEGRCVASIKAPVRVPIMQGAIRSETRKKMYIAACHSCKDVNGPVLEELLEARHKAAVALGFKNHAASILRFKTARTEETAVAFCEGMLSKLRPQFEAQRAEVLEAKKADIPDATVVDPWDLSFYIERVRKERRGIDSEQLKKYFPLRATLNNVLDIYSNLLGLSFEEDTTLPRWDEEVLAYRVLDDKAGGALKGYLYFDLFPREGKFGHQMILPLAPTFDGCLPACCYMGNLSRPEAGSEALLRITEVRTLFHELGHMMHAVCTDARYSALSWAWPMVPWPGGVEQDFLEVPSTMFEQWMLEPEVVQRVCSEVDGEKISKETILKLKQTSRELSIVEHLTRYYAMSLADLRLHSGAEGAANPVDIFSATMLEHLDYAPPKGSHFVASWYHVAIGYDAGYYGYGWAEVYAQDLFSAFREKGLFNAEAGAVLRAEVLAPCARRTAPDMLRSYLGREPSQDAYLREFGILDC